MEFVQDQGGDMTAIVGQIQETSYILINYLDGENYMCIKEGCQLLKQFESLFERIIEVEV